MATLKELRDQILLAVYNSYKNKTLLEHNARKFCNQNNITSNSDQELRLAFQSLKESEYLKFVFVTGSDIGIIQNITPAGVDYVEEYLLSEDEQIINALEETNKIIKSGVTIDDGSDDDSVSMADVPKDKDTSSSGDDVVLLYKTTENYKNISDLETPACFGVNALADCFIKQMDKIASHTHDNFCMLGIFGPWGRGKTYFFKKIKEKLTNRNDNNIKYKIVEFNAWKYQDTPAIWAYLYEKLYTQTNSCQKIKLWWKRLQLSFPSWGNVVIFLFIALIVWLLYFVTYKHLIENPNIQKILQNLQFPIIGVSLIFGIIYNFIKNPIPTYKYIIKCCQRKNYKSYLGIQNDLEKDLETLLTTMVSTPQKEQLLLYVDDIDRCSTDKMLEVINSLRIILENPKIQKRLMVVCSIDPNKLINGYCLQKAGKIDDNQCKEAREHIDKLFIFGIGLAPLDLSQYQEYLRTIAGINNTVNENEDTPPYSEGKQNDTFVAIRGTEEMPVLTDSEICNYIFSFVKGMPEETFTPRKLRIMYYRLLFANNIVAVGGGNLPRSIMKKILDKSINLDEEINNMTAYADVVNIVVPY